MTNAEIRIKHIQSTLNGLHRSMIKQIRKLVDPTLHNSGYVKLNSKGEKCGYIQLSTFDNNNEGESIDYRNENLDLAIEGFTEDGVISDSYMCIATISYENLSSEQLLFALQIAEEHHKELI